MGHKTNRMNALYQAQKGVAATKPTNRPCELHNGRHAYKQCSFCQHQFCPHRWETHCPRCGEAHQDENDSRPLVPVCPSCGSDEAWDGTGCNVCGHYDSPYAEVTE